MVGKYGNEADGSRKIATV